MVNPSEPRTYSSPRRDAVRLFLCGDVMTGRGLDQILGHPCDPTLHEDYVPTALDYLRLAEKANGPIARPVAPSYIWGDALDELRRAGPDLRIINLETAVTRSEQFAPKGINYRMSPENADCLTAAAIDGCVLANNHVLDWGRAGLLETLSSLERLKIRTAGAGRNAEQAGAPAILPVAGKARVLLYAFAHGTSGTPRSWAATRDGPGVNFLADLAEATAIRLGERIARERHAGDVVVVSIHWGANWGYDIPDEQRLFAHALIEQAGVSVVYGHSSHHPKGIEVYRNRLILYGCGDFLNDYEGIRGYEAFRGDLTSMYLPDIAPASGELTALAIVPFQVRKFRLVRPSEADIHWLWQRLDRECATFGASVAIKEPARLALAWRA